MARTHQRSFGGGEIAAAKAEGEGTADAALSWR